MENKKPKILIFSLAYQPFVGGAEIAIKEITNRLGTSAQDGQGFEFDMITVNLDGKQKKEERLGNINVHRLGSGKLSKYLFPWLAFQYAKKLHEKNNYNMIWAMMANQAGWAAYKFKHKFPRTQYLLSLQEGDSELDIWLRTWFMRPIYKSIYRRANQIQAISNFLGERAKKLGAKCPIVIVPNGINLQLGANERLITVDDKKTIITASRLVKKNGIEYLIRAMSDVDGKLIILGNGKLKLKLKSLVKNLNLENKVEFLGEVSNDQVYKNLSASAVFVRPSLSEGLGNAFLEAMSVGTPVIGTPVGGIPDFLKAGETGWFCKVSDPKSIAEKINYILDEKNKDLVERVVKNAKELVEEKYTWHKISQDMKNIFNSLIYEK